MSRGWLGRAGLAGIAVFVAVLGWTLLGPSRLGGGASYAVIAGSSMSPKLRSGDLAVLRESSEYETGDVVGYRSAELGHVVVHRIIDRQGDHLVLKGDANSWNDGVRPTPDEVIGELWLRAPGLGGVIVWLRSPPGLVLLGLTIVAAFVFFFMRSSPRRDAARGADAADPSGGGVPGLVTTLAAATICFMLLGIVAFTRPSSGAATFSVPFRHQGQFSYSARAMAPGVYQGVGATTGEPVFLRVAPSMNLRFAYRLFSQAQHTSTGTSRLVAEVFDPSGWKRTLELQAAKPFKGDTVTVAGTIDFSKVWDVIHRAEAMTGLPRGGYALAFVPEITVRGTVAGRPFEDRFTPQLGFRLDALQLALDTPAGDPASRMLVPTKDGSAQATRDAPRTIKLLGANVSVSSARVVSAGGIIMGLGAVALALGGRRRGRNAAAPGPEPEHLPSTEADVETDTGRISSTEAEAGQIRSRYGHMLLPVRSAGIRAFKRVVELQDVDVLAQIADRGAGIIFYEQQEGRHAYLVPEGDVAYRFVVEDEALRVEKAVPVQPRNKRAPVKAGFISRPSRR